MDNQPMQQSTPNMPQAPQGGMPAKGGAMKWVIILVVVVVIAVVVWLLMK